MHENYRNLSLSYLIDLGNVTSQKREGGRFKRFDWLIEKNNKS